MLKEAVEVMTCCARGSKNARTPAGVAQILDSVLSGGIATILSNIEVPTVLPQASVAYRLWYETYKVGLVRVVPNVSIVNVRSLVEVVFAPMEDVAGGQ
jgi:hypothetical protein